MAGEIAHEVEQGVKQVAEHVGTRLGPKLKEFFEDTKNKAVKMAEETAKTEEHNTQAIENITRDGEKGVAQDAEGAASGMRHGEGGGEPNLGEGERGGGVGSEGTGGCDGKGGDPVDAVSGQMITAKADVELPGLLPLVLRRAYASGYVGGRLHGPGWSSTLDQRIEIDDDGIHYAGDDAQILHYPHPAAPGRQLLPADGARWPLSFDQNTDTYTITDTQSGWVRHFAPNPADPALRPITTLSDRNGNRITYAHDRDGLPVAVGHCGGYRLSVETTFTDGGYRIEAVRLLDGSNNGVGTKMVSYEYDRLGHLCGVIDSTGIPYGYEYDDHGRITAWTDRVGYRYQYTYREDGRVIRGQGEGGYLNADFDYDLAGRVTTVTDSLGHATEYHYDQHNHLTKVVNALGHAAHSEYDRYHRLLSRTDPLGNTTRYTLDAAGDPIRIEQPDGTEARVEYGPHRLPVKVIGPDGAVWRHEYDERGNLTASTDPSGAVTRHDYGDRGEPLTTTDALGNTTTITANSAGLPVSVTDPSGAVWTYARDMFGRVCSVTDPLGAVTTTEWAGNDAPARRVHPDGTSEVWEWDANGDLLALTNQAGFATSFEIGPFHQITARTEPDGARYVFSHDTELRLLEVTNPQDLRWKYAYDEAGNLIEERDFNDRAQIYAHDAAGRLVRRTNGASDTIGFTRDALGRVIRQEIDEGGMTAFDYDAAGRLVHAAGPDCELTLTHDRLGRILTETVDGRTLTATYDQLGRRTSRTTPAGRVSTWQYDQLGQPVALISGGRQIWFGHDRAGQETYRWLSDTAAITSTWDSMGRLTARQLVGVEGSGENRASRLLHERSWSYRADGIPEAVADSAGGESRLTLDPLGRITAVHAGTWTEQYSYDAIGNLQQAADTRSPDSDVSGVRTMSGTLVRRAGRVHYDYDPQGRLVRAVRRTLSGTQRTWTYEYDANDRLTLAVDPAGERWRYRYDPLGRRVGKQRLDQDGAPIEETRFTWDSAVLVEQDQTGGEAALVTVTSWDYEPDSWRPVTQDLRTFYASAPQDLVDEQFHAIITDLVGTPTELVTLGGQIGWRRQTGLWGDRRSGPAAAGGDCLLRFPGQYHDEETGLDYNFMRYYDPDLAGYTTPDPLGLAPAPHHYGYVDNPLAWIDPLGLARKKNLGPDPDAVGPHVTFRRDGSTGQIVHYAEWEPQTNPMNPNPWQMVKRVDMQGVPHYDKVTGTTIPTPHVNLPDGSARPTEPWEETKGPCGP